MWINPETSPKASPLSKPKNIILIGFMGCGKSHIGRQLAKRLKWPFMDADRAIQDWTNKTIKKIFADEGEEAFRKLEQNWCKNQLPKLHHRVIATGGGIVLNPLNQSALKANGLVVWLQISAQTVFDRVKNSKKRPLLNTENPFKTIQTLLAQREDIYRQSADKIVKVEGKSDTEIVSEIYGLFRP